MTLPPLPDPESGDVDPRTEAIHILRKGGAPPEYVEFLADSLLADARAVAPDSMIEYVENEIRHLSILHTGRSENRDSRMVQALLDRVKPRTILRHSGSVTEFIGPDGRDPRARLKRLLPQWLEAEPRIDIVSGALALQWDPLRPGLLRAILRMTQHAGRLRVRDHLDWEAVLAGRGGGNPDNPQHLWFWWTSLRRRALRALLPLLEESSEAEAGRVAWRISESLRFFLQEYAGSEFDAVVHPDPRDLLTWIRHVEARLDESPGNLLLCSSLWNLMRAGVTIDIPESDERRLVDFTLRKIAAFRKRLQDRRFPIDASWDDETIHYFHALIAVRDVEGPWKALKATLLLLRAVPYPSVGPDLRDWTDRHDSDADDPPASWRWIAGLCGGLMREWAREERPEDPELIEMRELLARFCLDRLRSRSKDREAVPRSDSDMLEPSPHWRRGHIQAVLALGVNPTNRGHHVLNWLRTNDPHDVVRAEAEIAYEQVRRTKSNGDRMSPLRRVLGALWWMRWAHRLELGLPVDEDGARRVRQREIRRARKAEDVTQPN